MSWGATITKFMAEDGTDIVLGFDNFKGKFDKVKIITKTLWQRIVQILFWDLTVSKVSLTK
jgi:hypothetical protein